MSDYVLLNINDIVEKFPVSKGIVRHWLSDRKSNGLDKAVRKIGRRVFIREDLLIEWIEGQKE